MKSRFVVYKCVFSDYDVILRPSVVTKGCDYVVVTDNPDLFASGWQKHVVSAKKFSSAKEANLFYRSTFHEHLDCYEASLYLDGNIQICSDISGLFEKFVNSGAALGLQKHPERVSVAAEIEACIEFKKLKSVSDAWDELNYYRSLGFCDDMGLFETGLIFKNHSVDGLNEAMNAWYDAFRKFGQRDQLSLPFVLWKTGVSYSKFDYGLRDPVPENFFLYPHWKSCSKFDWLNVYIRAHRYNGGIWPAANIVWDKFQLLRGEVSLAKRLQKLTKG